MLQMGNAPVQMSLLLVAETIHSLEKFHWRINGVLFLEKAR
jgi:hypothetical protein